MLCGAMRRRRFMIFSAMSTVYVSASAASRTHSHGSALWKTIYHGEALLQCYRRLCCV